MKKNILVLTLVLTLVPVFVFGQTGGVQGVLDRIISWLGYFVASVAAIFIMIAGYYFITAQGDSDKLGKARNMILYAIIGIVVVVVAVVLADFVKSAFSI
ncbi:MAG: hypothetical protein PHI53_03155 [Candidatus Pacebacteria bacterium]|nr:hypothetical protein [Candidatus Paceibacterota bacterium]